MARTPKARSSTAAARKRLPPADAHKERDDTPAVLAAAVATADQRQGGGTAHRSGASNGQAKNKRKNRATPSSSSKENAARGADDDRRPFDTPDCARISPAAGAAAGGSSKQPPKASLFGFSRSPHTSCFNVDEILQKAETSQKSPITNKAELELHKELSRRPCPIISEYRKKEKLAAMGCRWDKELKTWTTTNINLAREHRDVIIFIDGFLPPRCAVRCWVCLPPA